MRTGEVPQRYPCQLWRNFEVDRYCIAHAAIDALAKDGKMTAKDAARAIQLYKLDPEKPNPFGV